MFLRESVHNLNSHSGMKCDHWDERFQSLVTGFSKEFSVSSNMFNSSGVYKDVQCDKVLKTESKDSIKQLSFFKNQNSMNEDHNSKLFQHLFPRRNSVSKESKNANHVLKPNFALTRENYKSHKKIPSKMKTPRDFFKASLLEPIKLDQSHLPGKTKIIHNLFCKQDRYFYCNNIDIRSLVRSIYYNGYTVDNLEEFKFTAFKRIANQQEFFGIIYEEGKTFTLTAHKIITSKIQKLVEKTNESAVSGKNLIRFVPFLSHTKKYEQIVNELYNHFKHLEQVNVEIEKLTRQFIQSFMDKSNYECDGFNFHSRLFVIYVYSNQLIFHFFDQLFRMFKRSSFCENKYSCLFEKVFEIYENSKQHTSQSKLNSAETIHREMDRPKDDNQNKVFFSYSNQINPGSGLKQTEKKQDSQQNKTGDNANTRASDVRTQNGATENMTEVKNLNSGNANKKKKKKNKKTLTEVSTALPEERTVEIGSEMESFQELKDFKLFEEKLQEVNRKYAIPSNSRFKVQFNSQEAKTMESMVPQVLDRS